MASWDDVQDLRISGDGSRVFNLVASRVFYRVESEIWVWSILTGEVVGKMEIEYYGGSRSLIVDESKVWACWLKSNYKGWDLAFQAQLLWNCPICLHSLVPIGSGTPARPVSRV